MTQEQVRQEQETMDYLYEVGYELNQQIKSEKRYNWSMESVTNLIRNLNQISIEIDRIDSIINR